MSERLAPLTPRLLRIVDAAHYLSCTYTFMETLIRERSVPSFIIGKRRLIDRFDLDAFVDRKKLEKLDEQLVEQQKASGQPNAKDVGNARVNRILQPKPARRRRHATRRQGESPKRKETRATRRLPA